LPILSPKIKKRLIATDLKAYRPRKVALLKLVHMKRKIGFVKKFINEPENVWSNILSAYQTKFVQ